jgi:hypothetical protein|tara:strand:- start:281 stop:760 length:480 start_codon:yes stop_codon:yes gene_type:complete
VVVQEAIQETAHIQVDVAAEDVQVVLVEDPVGLEMLVALLLPKVKTEETVLSVVTGLEVAEVSAVSVVLVMLDLAELEDLWYLFLDLNLDLYMDQLAEFIQVAAVALVTQAVLGQEDLEAEDLEDQVADLEILAAVAAVELVKHNHQLKLMDQVALEEL